MIALEDLRDFAARHPNVTYPLGSCTSCLAAQMAGKMMNGFDKYLDDTPVDPRWADFTRRVVTRSYANPGFSSTVIGYKLRDALNALIDGAAPRDVAAAL